MSIDFNKLAKILSEAANQGHEGIASWKVCNSLGIPATGYNRKCVLAAVMSEHMRGRGGLFFSLKRKVGIVWVKNQCPKGKNASDHEFDWKEEVEAEVRREAIAEYREKMRKKYGLD